MINLELKEINQKLPDFKGSSWLIRIPLSIVFIQQGLSKIPLDMTEADVYNLPLHVWLIVILSELTAGFGLLFGGALKSFNLLTWFGDFLTRFSGTIMVGVICGVIIVSKPTNLFEVLLYDHLHVDDF